MRISVLALDGYFDTGLSVTLDALAIANKLSAIQLGNGTRFEVTIVGTRRKVTSGQGMRLSVSPIDTIHKPDWVLVPALTAGSFEQLLTCLARPDVVKATKQLQTWNAMGSMIGASCIGTFLLAEAGLLDYCQATTTWWFSPMFRQRYPNVMLDESRMLVPSKVGVTAGAAMGHLDLVLWLIRRASPELANLVSRYLLADIRASQAAYIIPNHLAQADPLILQFERWSRHNLSKGFSLQEVSKSLAVSSRSLQRRCQDVLGKSPLAYFQDLRVEHAQSLLMCGTHSLEAIATEVGYADGATLRTLIRERLGRGVREIRNSLR